MQVIRYQDPQRFQTEIKHYLLQHEAENNLLLGILADMIAGEYLDLPPYLMQVTDNGNTQMVVMRTPPFPVLFSYSPLPIDEEILELALEDLWNEFGSDLSGITAEKSLAACLSDRWTHISGKSAERKMASRIFKLDKVQPVSGVPGNLRQLDEQDTPLVMEWFANFSREALREEPDSEIVKKGVERYFRTDPQQRGLMLWEVEGNPVSMAGYAGPTTNGIRINAVYTPPGQRNQGYASACTAGLSQYLLDLGFQICFIFTDVLNPTSNNIYRQIGYEPVCDVDRFEFT